MEQQRELLSAKLTAAYLGLSRTTLWRRTKDGTLPGPIRIAGMTRWRVSELNAFLDEVGANRDGAA